MITKLRNFIFGTPSEPEPVEPVEQDDTPEPRPRKRKAFDWEGVLKQTFQRTGAEDTDGQAVAMDSACDNVPGVKMQRIGRMENISPQMASWYASQGFIGYQMCAMIMQHWLVDKACTIPAQDAVRNGYTLDVKTDAPNVAEIKEFYSEAAKRFNINENLEQFVRMGRCFGIRIALFKVDSSDPEYYAKPFNPDGVTRGSYKGISQVDPYWVTPELDAAAAADPSSIHFYEPTFWRISGQRYHRSHLVIMRSGDVPDVLKPSYMYGGMPLTQKIYERVYAAERVANEAPQLLLTKRATVLHTDIAKAFADPARFESLMNEWREYLDNFGVKVVGDKEVIEQFDTTLTDLDVTVMTQYQLVAAIAEVPATKLLGTSPKGFNATGEFESQSYHESLESIQTHFCTPLLDRHNLLLMRSEVMHKFLDGKPAAVQVAWEPVDSMSAEQQANVNKIKADTGQVLIASGAIDGQEERARLKADEYSGYSGLTDELPADETDAIIDEL